MKIIVLVDWYVEQLKKVLFSEYTLWITVSLLVSARFLMDYSENPRVLFFLINAHYFELLFSALLAIFPFVFYQVFGYSPLQAIKESRGRNRGRSGNIVIGGNGNTVHLPSEDNASVANKSIDSVGDTNVTNLLVQLSKKSELLSNKIYTRSGIYLIFGVLIAFSGILYFSFQSINLSGEKDIIHSLILLAPRFGILFFIEFIAFFFLKQYRAAMDEFRHYDTIKRNRESQLAIFLMATNEFSEKNFNTVIEKINFFEKVGNLSAGETTELVELSKINKNELEILKELVVELVQKSKSSESSKATK